MDNERIENGSSNRTLLEREGIQQESLLHIALRHRWTIFLTTVLFLITAFVYILKATPIFTSSSRLYAENPSGLSLKL